MSDKGIIFSAPMVRALLAGTKTQTRRLCKWANNPLSPALNFIVPVDNAPGWFGDEKGEVCFSAGYKPGDRLWVRETWAVASIYDGMKPREINPEGIPLYCGIRYAATDERLGIKDRSCRFMPRWASRLWLEVTDVRVQRLQDISTADAIAEGVTCATCPASDVAACAGGCLLATGEYTDLWNSLHDADGERWDDDPWIVAVSFKIHRENIDKPEPRCPHGEPLKGGWCAGCAEECEEAA